MACDCPKDSLDEVEAGKRLFSILTGRVRYVMQCESVYANGASPIDVIMLSFDPSPTPSFGGVK